MCIATIHNITIYHEVHGQGKPLLLIMGLGSHILNWGPIVPEALAQRRQVILFDNRGAGRSEQDPGPYGMSQFAADTVGLLDYLGVEQADVLGVSMGGMIAQHVALDYPDRVDRLILGCTNPGGDQSVRADQEILDMLWADENLDEFQAAWKGLPSGFTDEFIAQNPALLTAHIRRTRRYASTDDAYQAQIDAIVDTHRTYHRLPDIRHQTLVITGDADKLVPAENSYILMDRLPNARLDVIPNAGHAFWISHPEEMVAAVEGFLG